MSIKISRGFVHVQLKVDVQYKSTYSFLFVANKTQINLILSTLIYIKKDIVPIICNKSK